MQVVWARWGTDPELGRISVVWYRYVDLDVVCGTSSLELCFDFDHVLYPTTFVVFNLKETQHECTCCKSIRQLTAASTQTRGLTGVESRYDMSSNSPSGGMNEMVRSFSNRDRRTHWWNLTSSISIAFPRAA